MASVAKEKMGRLSCFLAPKKKKKPSPKRLKNIRLCCKGCGHYDETGFNDAIYGKCVEQDWWIESEAYAKLLNDLATVDFSGLHRGANVSDLIARVPKDMPANPGARFPHYRGTLGGEDYAPLRFVRVDQEVRGHFFWLLELRNPASYGKLGSYGYPGNYFEVLRDVVSATVPSYGRDSFESTFGLVWDNSVIVKTKSCTVEN